MKLSYKMKNYKLIQVYSTFYIIDKLLLYLFNMTVL